MYIRTNSTDKDCNYFTLEASNFIIILVTKIYDYLKLQPNNSCIIKPDDPLLSCLSSTLKSSSSESSSGSKSSRSPPKRSSSLLCPFTIGADGALIFLLPGALIAVIKCFY